LKLRWSDCALRLRAPNDAFFRMEKKMQHPPEPSGTGQVFIAVLAMVLMFSLLAELAK
jgi:hypothetical protein